MDCNNCVWGCRDGSCSSWDCYFIDKEEAVKAWMEKKTADVLQNIPKLSIDTDEKLMVHLLAEICGYAVKNGMEPNDTIRTIANNFLALLEIATFNGWKGEFMREKRKRCGRMKSFEIDDAINMFEQAIEQQDTDFPNECRQFVGWLKELKWWRSLEKNCGTCKHCDKDEQEEPCVKCFDPDDPHDVDYYWECGYEGTTKQEDVPDTNVGDMINCTDCIKHGGDWECDRKHCHKGTKQQATKASDCISRRAAIVQLSHNKTGDDDCDVVIQNDIETIKALPSAEPEIVTCKECKRRGEEPIADGRYWCEVHNTFMYYCSDAERRTDE